MYNSISRFSVNQQMLAEGLKKCMKALSAKGTPEYNAFDVLFKYYGGVKSFHICRPMAIQTEEDFCKGKALKIFSSSTVEELIDDPLFGPFNELILEKATALSELYGSTPETSLRFGYSLINYIFYSDIPSERIKNVEGFMRYEYSSLSRHISFDTSLAIVKWFIWLLSDENKYANTLLNKIDALAISKRNIEAIRPYKECEYNQVEARFRAILKIIALTDLSDPEKVVPMTEQMIENVKNCKDLYATQETEEPEVKSKEPIVKVEGPEEIDGSEAVNIQRGQGEKIKTHKITAKRACEIIKAYRLPILMSKEDCKGMLSMLLGLDETSFTKYL